MGPLLGDCWAGWGVSWALGVSVAMERGRPRGDSRRLGFELVSRAKELAWRGARCTQAALLG